MTPGENVLCVTWNKAKKYLAFSFRHPCCLRELGFSDREKKRERDK